MSISKPIVVKNTKQVDAILKAMWLLGVQSYTCQCHESDEIQERLVSYLKKRKIPSSTIGNFLNIHLPYTGGVTYNPYRSKKLLNL